MSWDVHKVRQDFPLLEEKSMGEGPIIYLDNGATTLKPRPVINALMEYYSSYSANIHRGIHQLSQRATDRFEQTRTLIQQWINAPSLEEIILTSGTTGSLNLLAHSYGSLLRAEDEIVLSVQEHHSNIVPWQLLKKKRKGLTLKVIPVNDQGELELEELQELLSSKTKIVTIPHVSNTLGTINPVKEIVSLVHKHCDAVIIVDGAQAMAHLKVDVQDLGVDFYCFSAHKLFGPTGLGVLFGKKRWLDQMPPFMGGGDMIEHVSFRETTFAPLPQKFEAGTPHIAGSIGLGAALEYLQSLGMGDISSHEQELTAYGQQRLQDISGLKLIGKSAQRVAIFTFILEGIHAQDLATILDRKGIAVRTGHHCTWPLLKRFGVDSTTRASLAMYNTKSEIDQLIQAIEQAKEILL